MRQKEVEMDLELKTKKDGTSLTVALKGEINTQTAPELSALLEENLPGMDALSLDFAECDFVSSAGLRVLLNTYKGLKARKGKMEFLNIGPSFKEVLNITGLDRVFGVS